MTPSVRAARGRGGDRLLERERELATIDALVTDACSGRGRVLVIHAQAGLGKTALTEHAATLARATGVRVLMARGGPLERDLSWGLVRALLDPLLVEPADARLFEGAAGHARGLLGFAGAGTTRPDVALHALYWLVANLADKQPVLLVVDDAHWGDPASLGFLQYLARRLDGLRAAMIVAARPDVAGETPIAELLLVPGTRRIRPEPLGERSVAVLVRERLGAAPAPEFSRACHAATAGNPFLVRTLLDALAAEGVRPVASASDRVGEAGAYSILPWLLSRVSRLAADVRPLAQALAVLGGEAELRHAAALADVDAAAAGAATDVLVRAGFLETERPLRFVHPLVRGALYADLTPAARSQLHARAARVLAAAGAPPDRVAAHLLSAEPAGDPANVRLLRGAGADAVARGDAGAAAGFLARALAEPPAPPVRGDVLFELGQAEALAGRADAIGHLEEAVSLAVDARVASERAVALGHALMWAGRGADAVALLERAIAALDGRDPELEARLQAALVGAAAPDRELLPLAQRRLERLRGRSFGDDRTGRALAAQLAFHLAFSSEPAGDAAALAERALSSERGADQHAPDSATGFFALVALTTSDRLEHAHALWSQALRAAGERGSARAFAVASTFRAATALRLGDLTGAEADARAALELAVDPSLAVAHDFAAAFLVRILVACGTLEQASAIADQPSACDNERSISHACRVAARAGLLGALGDHDAVVEMLQHAARRWDGWTQNPALLTWRSTLAASLQAVGRREPALALAREQLEFARRLQSHTAIGIALRTCGVIEGGAGGLALLEDAVVALARSEARLDYARALIAHGAALRAAGRRPEARDALAAGLDLSARCGARRLADHAHAELVATGARPRRPFVTGREALTPAERRVAELAGQGMTNRAVAQALFVTQKTVEMHLGRAYAKLGIASRRDLRDALDADIRR